MEETLKPAAQAEKRLEMVSKQDKAFEAAIDNVERAENEISQTAEALQKIKIRQTILREEEKRKRATDGRA